MIFRSLSSTMKHRTVYLWMLCLMFLVSLYNFLSIALLKAEEFTKSNLDKDEEIIGRNNNKATNRLVSSNVKAPTAQQDHSDKAGEEISHEDWPVYQEPKIFWDAEVEAAIPRSANVSQTCEQFRNKLAHMRVKRVEPASFTKCGRPNNAYAQLEDGTPVCIRYRHPHDYLVAGEVLSFHLAKYLGINVPCVVLSSSGKNDKQKWPADFKTLNWVENVNIALIQWIPDLSANLRLPKLLQNSLATGQPVRYYDVHGKSVRSRANLAQWGGMFLYDYIIGHHDRFARLQDDAEKENRTSVLKNIIPNVGVDKSGLMWIFDNEPGLLDAYELMYQTSYAQMSLVDSVRFQKFHNETLKLMCIFRKKLLLSVIRLYQKDDPVNYLMKLAEINEPNVYKLKLGLDLRYQKYFRDNFRRRLANVISHSKWCADTVGENDKS